MICKSSALQITTLLIAVVMFTTMLSSAAECGNSHEGFFKIPKLVLKEDKGIGSRDYSIDIRSNVQTLKFNTSTDSYSKRSLTDLNKTGLRNSNQLSDVNEFLKSDNISENSRTRYFSDKYLKDVNSDFKYWESEKRFGTAVWELAIIEFIPWALSKYIMKPGWANVGFQSWWSNIQNGWEYDGDNFLTNNFAHPYHGNLYFNSARTNGYNFWESVPFAFGGSLLWEYFGEYYRPSFNDWINTSVSGFNLGEMTYRVANLVTDNTTRGSQRVWSEIWGALLNPVRGFNRLISGEASKVHPNIALYDVPVRLYVDGGMRRVVKSGSDFAGDSVSTEGMVGFNLIYGNENSFDLDQPFSRFRVWGHISNGSSKLTELFSYGLLKGWKLGGKEKNKQLFTLNITYNFMTNPAFEFGGPALLGVFTLKNMLGEKTFLKSDLGLYAVLMGSTSTEYFYGEDGRDYDFGPGPGILLSTSITDGTWNYVSAMYQGFTILTMSGSPDSKHYLHNALASFTLPINNYFGIGLEASVFWRNSFYKDPDPDVSRTSPMGRLFFITKL
ncbi:MAG: DUF3943 domain-containing protein [Ignavibacteria bacterium]|nr:DUF3943 domain-containing protein [Ignavibacteria bacterium]